MNPRYGIASVLAYALGALHWQLSHFDPVATVRRHVVLIDSMPEIDSVVIELFVVLCGVGLDGDNAW